MNDDVSAAQFVTINVDGTVTSNDTCVVISRSSRIQYVRGDSGRVCAGVIFYQYGLSFEFRPIMTMYRQSKNQSHVFLIFSACMSCAVVIVKCNEQLNIVIAVGYN